MPREVDKPRGVLPKGWVLTSALFVVLIGLGMVAGIVAIEMGRG